MHRVVTPAVVGSNPAAPVNYARVVKLVYTGDLKSPDLRSYGFESRLWYHIFEGVKAVSSVGRASDF